MRKEPYMTDEFFNAVISRLKDNGQIPNNIDYIRATDSPEPIRTDEFSITNNLDFGGSEGAYLDLAIRIVDDDGNKAVFPLGCIKTLEEGQEGLRNLAVILADFIYEVRQFYQENWDDFLWNGYTVEPRYKDSQRPYKIHPRSYTKALEHVEKLFRQGASSVAVRDNALRTEVVYNKREDIGEEIP